MAHGSNPMTLWKHYHLPETVDDALSILQSYQGQARVIAGGTDLLLDLRQGHMPPVEALVDISRVSEMNEIRPDGTAIYIGAGVTHSAIVKLDILQQRATCLVESCGVVGGPQVRNVGTLGGNVVHALPAGDGTTSLVALDAEAEIVKQGERQWVPIRDMYLGPGLSLLDPTNDVLIRLRVPLSGPREGTAFKRIMRPQGVALPILGCAVWVRLDEAHTHYEDVHVTIGPVSKVPVRVTEVEDVIRGSAVGDETLEQAVVAARESLRPRTSKYRATAEYRLEMVEVLLRRVLPLAATRARTGEAVPEGVGME